MQFTEIKIHLRQVNEISEWAVQNLTDLRFHCLSKMSKYHENRYWGMSCKSVANVLYFLSNHDMNKIMFLYYSMMSMMSLKRSIKYVILHPVGVDRFEYHIYDTISWLKKKS